MLDPGCGNISQTLSIAAPKGWTSRSIGAANARDCKVIVMQYPHWPDVRVFGRREIVN
jgi:hypothetical protein